LVSAFDDRRTAHGQGGDRRPLGPTSGRAEKAGRGQEEREEKREEREEREGERGEGTDVFF
jgi:hypothetical protein